MSNYKTFIVSKGRIPKGWKLQKAKKGRKIWYSKGKIRVKISSLRINKGGEKFPWAHSFGRKKPALAYTFLFVNFGWPGVYPGLLQKRVPDDFRAGGMVCGGLSLLYTQKFSKITAVHATAWHFGAEGSVKTNFCVKGYENSKDTAFSYFFCKFLNIFIINRDIVL